MARRYNVSSSTGTFNGVTAGSVTANSAVFIGQSWQKVKALSALVTADCETDTMTLTPVWQVSEDGSTWVDVAALPNNAANVVWLTGTAGADAAATKVFPAPDLVYAWKYARFGLLVGVTTGAAGDTYTMSYTYRQLTTAE